MVCKNCGQQNAPTDVFCTYCGTLLALNDNEKIVVDCPVCGHENESSDKYCFKCGSSLKKASVRKVSFGPVRVTMEQSPAVAETEEAKPVVNKPVYEPVSVAQPSLSDALFADSALPATDPLEDAVDSFAAPVRQKKPRVVCPHCGVKNDADAMYCCDCAQSMTPPRRKDKEVPAKKQASSAKKSAKGKKKPTLAQMVIKKLFGKKKKKTAAKATVKPKTAAKKKIPFAQIGIVAAALVVLVLVAAGIGAVSGGSDYVYDADDFRFDFSAGTGSFTLFANGKAVGSLASKDVPDTIYYNLDNSCGVFAVPLQENGAAATAVYYFDEDGMTRLMDTVNSVIYLSADGSALLYIDSNAALSLYMIESQTNITIAENGKYVSGAYAISPDGEAVLYCYRNESNTNSVCAYYNGEYKDICTSGVPVAVTDGADKIYYLTVLNNTYDFYMTTFKKPAKFNKIASSVYASSIKLNYDMDEILFSLIDGSTYYSKGGKQAERITSASVYPVMCNFVNFKNCSGIATVYGMDNFFDCFWLGERGLYVAMKGHEPRMLVANMTDFDISADGETLVYVDADGNLFIRELANVDEDASAVAENVTAVAVTGNGNSVYYLNSVLALCSVNAAGESVLIDQNVDGIKCTEKGVFYKSVSRTQEYAVSYCSNEKQGKVISNSVQNFLISDGCVYYTSGDGQHLYYSKNGTRNFKQLY